MATVTMALVPLLWIGGAGASPAIDLQTSVTTMTWAGGRVTLSAFGGPTGTKCLVTAAPTVVISTPAWTCGPGLHTSTAHLPSNDSSHPVHYRFILTPGDLLAEVTVSSADYGGDLRVTSQPSNAAISADGSSTYDTTTLRAKSSGNPTPVVQWYSASVPGHWSAVKGATRRTLVVSAATLSGFVVQYRATFSNRKNSVTTRPATIYEVTYGRKWAGYVDVASDGHKFSSISGSWTVPTVTCGAATSWETTWVGIDGQTNATVEQAGTSDVCQDGVPYYSAFYELWGYASEKNGGLSVSLPTSSDPVAPGDSVSAEVSFANGHWVFMVDDATAGWHSSTPVAQPIPTPAQSSAEWIVEAPQLCENLCTTAVLAHTTPVTFARARATQSKVTGTISTWPTLAFAIQSDVKPLDQVGALSPGGTSFTVSSTKKTAK